MVTRLQCPDCESELSGNFTLGRIYRLNPQQMHFVELMIKNRGNVSRVGEELGIPYSAARSRLDEIIRALGYQVEEEPGVPPETRREILARLAAGEITAEEAARQLRGA
jgi:hypothetical protein